MVFREEIIGSNIEVVNATNLSQFGINGKIVDETRNMIVLDCNKIIEKKNVVIKINDGNKIVEIKGKSLIGRSEERFKGLNKND